MAAARSAFTTWCRKIRTIELLKKQRCISVGIASYCTGSTNNIEFLRANVVTNHPNVCFMKTNFPRSSTSFPHFENYQNTNLELVKPIRNLNTRWISTTVPHLNGKTSKTSSGKSKLKDRIEKVKEMVHRESILTIPNLLSSFRIVAAPFLGYFIISEQFLIAVTLFGVAGITDMLDGYIARNFKNQKSVFGTILDPIADKVLMSVLVISLTVAELLPIPLTALILGRDFLLVLAAFYIRFKSLPPPKTVTRYFDVNLATVELRPNFLGKLNTVLQLGLVGSTLSALVMGYGDHQFLHILWYMVGTSTVLSSISYLFSANTAVRYLK